MRCTDCEHVKAVHFSQVGEAVPCRITGCKCQGFKAPAPAEQTSTEARRICIDVPDGYTLFAQFVPHGGKIEVLTTVNEEVTSTVEQEVSVETDDDPEPEEAA